MKNLTANKFIKQMGGVEMAEEFARATDEMLKANWPVVRNTVYQITKWPEDWGYVTHWSELTDMQKTFLIDRVRKLSIRALDALHEKQAA